MARFLFCPAPEAGDTYPAVPVALALKSRGHEVACLTSPAFEPDLHHERIPSFSMPGGVYGTGQPSGPDAVCRSLFVAAPPHSSAAEIVGALRAQAETLERVFDEFRADVLVDGSFPFAARLLSEARGIPRASIHAGCFPIPTRDPLFPYGPGQPPPTDERGRTLARLASLMQAEQDRDAVMAWDAARASLDLPACGVHPARSAASPDLVLLATPPALEYPRSDLPPQFWFTGPLTWQTRLACMPERVAGLTTRAPIVYVSQGATYNRNPVILRRAFEALGSEPVQIVATVVRAFDPAEFEPLPSNAILERFVPFSELVDRLSLVITHGGAGAVHAALSRGVPVIVLPLAADQFEVAARCAWTGAGIRLDPWACTAAQLREAVRNILSDPSYRARAREIGNSCARLGGPELAATLLERLAETRQPVLRPASTYPWAAGSFESPQILPSNSAYTSGDPCLRTTPGANR